MTTNVDEGKRVDNITAILRIAAENRDYEFWLMLAAIEKIRSKHSAYIWGFPISYYDDKGRIFKQTFGWEIEFCDSTVKSYTKELPNYHDAIKEAIKTFDKVIHDEIEINPT